mmetsp:Transcript_20885/g.31522  ORF Transcript_20885/g.31522 Transcript_20885/m.31522 type:complete len:242 (-) Transcript_20885:400-1125(-)
MIQVKATVTLGLFILGGCRGSIFTHNTEKRQPSTVTEHLNRVVRTSTFQKSSHTTNTSHGGIQISQIVPIPSTHFLPKVLVENVHVRSLLTSLTLISTSRRLSINLLKDTLGVEHSSVNLIRRNVPFTYQENFSRLLTTSRWLYRLHISEELLGNPKIGTVISTTIELCNELSILSQVLRCTLESMQCNLILLICILIVRCTNVRCTITKNYVSSSTLHLTSNSRFAFLSGNISNQSDNIL